MRDDTNFGDRLDVGELRLAGRFVQTGLRPGQPFAPGAALSVVAPAWIVPEGVGPDESAGIWRDFDVAAWRRFVAASMAEGRPLALPLWHAGRLSHSLAQPGGTHPVGPSPVAAEGGLLTYAGWRAFPVPRPLRDEELPEITRRYAEAARRARAAGFDAVEVHAAAGGLLHQFLDAGSNWREPPYGGSAENRARFPLDVVLAAARAVGTGRLGLVLPWPRGMADTWVLPSALALLRAVRPLGLAWLRLRNTQPMTSETDEAVRALRDAFGGPVILGPVADPAEAHRLLRTGLAEAVAVHTAHSQPDGPSGFAPSDAEETMPRGPLISVE